MNIQLRKDTKMRRRGKRSVGFEQSEPGLERRSRSRGPELGRWSRSRGSREEGHLEPGLERRSRSRGPELGRWSRSRGPREDRCSKEYEHEEEEGLRRT